MLVVRRGIEFLGHVSLQSEITGLQQGSFPIAKRALSCPAPGLVPEAVSGAGLQLALDLFPD
jgi:hypothetical protein